MDIQYIAESSLALAYYVISYVTKAEKSHMQDVWNEVMKRSQFTKGCGALASNHCILVNVACTKLQTYSWVTIYLRNLKPFNEYL